MGGMGGMAGMAGMPGMAGTAGESEKKRFTVQHPDRTVWIGNLPPDTDYQELKQFMEQAGSVKKVQVSQRHGTGFAFFSSDMEAQTAITTLDGALFNGYNIKVDTYTKKGPEPQGKGGFGAAASAMAFTNKKSWVPPGKGMISGVMKPYLKQEPWEDALGKGSGKQSAASGSRPKVTDPDRTVWIGNLAPGTAQEELTQVMWLAGEVQHVHIGAKGSGWAQYKNVADASKAIQNLNGYMVNYVPIEVDSYTGKTPKNVPGLGSGNGQKGGGNGAMGGGLQQMLQQFGNMKGQMGQMPWPMNNALMSGKGQENAGKGSGQWDRFKVMHTERTVWLGNLGSSTFQELKEHLAQAGDVKRVQVLKNGTGFALFSAAEEAQLAITMLNDSVVNGNQIQVDTWERKQK